MRCLCLLGLLALSACSASGLAPDVQSGDAEDRAILGGVPYDGMDVVRVQNGTNDGTCGGVHLGDGWVLTAAHCVHQASSYDVSVDGMWVDEVIVHPEFTAGGANDIALVHTETDARVVSLSTALGFDYAHYNTLDWSVAGYGRTELHGSGSSDLLVAGVEIYDECGGTSSGDDQFCTSAAVCVGDDGGPVIATVDGEPTVMGIISRSRLCGDADGDAVHTYVPHHLDWIGEWVDVSTRGDDHVEGWGASEFEALENPLLEGSLSVGDVDSFAFYWNGDGTFSYEYVSDEPLLVRLVDEYSRPIEAEDVVEEGWYRLDVAGVWGTEVTDYLVEVTADDHGDAWWDATSVESGSLHLAHLSAGDTDVFEFTLEAGLHVVQSHSYLDGSAFPGIDLVGTLTSVDGSMVLFNDDETDGLLDFGMEFTLTETTTFTLEVSGYDQSVQGWYRISI